MRLRDFDHNFNTCPVAAAKRLSLIEFEKYPPEGINQRTKQLITNHLNGLIPANKDWLKFKGKLHI